MDLISIRLHVSELVENILDCFEGELHKLIKEETYIAGGCFKSLLLDETINDYDFWFRSKEASEKFVLLVNKLDFLNPCFFTNRDKINLNKILYKTDNAYTFKFSKNKIQFILCAIGTPEEVVGNFDFYHTQCYYDPISGLLSCPTALTIGKTLTFNKKGTTTPLSSLKRAFKFVKQGWTISDEQIENITKAIVGLDWTKPEVVKKQTEGFYKDMPEEDAPEQPLAPPAPTTRLLTIPREDRLVAQAWAEHPLWGTTQPTQPTQPLPTLTNDALDRAVREFGGVVVDPFTDNL